jgi:hypothetical protein
VTSRCDALITAQDWRLTLSAGLESLCGLCSAESLRTAKAALQGLETLPVGRTFKGSPVRSGESAHWRTGTPALTGESALERASADSKALQSWSRQEPQFALKGLSQAFLEALRSCLSD